MIPKTEGLSYQSHISLCRNNVVSMCAVWALTWNRMSICNTGQNHVICVPSQV